MKRGLRIVGGIILLLLVGLGSQYQADIPIKELKKHYTNEASQFIEIEGMPVHFRDEGEGVPLVLLHGTASSLHTWDAWTTNLKATYRVIRLDLPAFGLTGPHPEHRYTLPDYVAFLAKFLAELGIERCHLAGNSLGGNIAWNFAATYPQRVEKLILVNPSGYPTGKKRPWIFTLAATPVANGIVRYITPRFLIEKNLQQVYYNDAKITEALIERYYDFTLREGNREAFIERAKVPFTDRTQQLSAIQAPTLVMWGKEDAWIPASLGQRFAEAIPHAELVLMDSTGHIPMEENPDKSIQVVRSFLSKQQTTVD